MLNIVIPMAGKGSRFSTVGYLQPKPLIEIHSVPMIRYVIQNLTPNLDHRFIFIAQEKHVIQNDLANKLAAWAPGSVLKTVQSVTSGAAATVLAAKDLIDGNEPLLIANSDQWINFDINSFLPFLSDSDVDGSIMTMFSQDPKWSYAELSDDEYVVRVEEKNVISNLATVGIYGFKEGRDFVSAAESMIQAEQTVNGEYYVAPVYNLLIREGMKFKTTSIGAEGSGMHGLGTPEDLEKFVSLPFSSEIWKK